MYNYSSLLKSITRYNIICIRIMYIMLISVAVGTQLCLEHELLIVILIPLQYCVFANLKRVLKSYLTLIWISEKFI